METISSSQASEMYEFKGKLFNYAQTHGFDEPNYIFKNEGFPHAPRFRITVNVAGHVFTASETFKRRKDAEHFISKLAFETLSQQARANVVSTSFLKGSKLCKSILYEYSVKKGKMDLPLYDTKVPESGPSTVFVSEVMFDNNTIVGPLSRSTKEAEQNAALVAITSLLENSETRCLISEVIQKVMRATAASAESDPNKNPNPNDNAASHVGSVKEPAEVREKSPLISPGFWTVPNNTCKSILKEYSDKKGYQDLPLYKTHAHESGPLQAFVSSVSFEGNMYYGPLSRSKKEAEQAAARVAIDSILGNPVSNILMLHAMQSKIKLHPSWDVNLISNPSTDPNEVNTTLDQASTNPKAKQVGDSSVSLVESLPSAKSSAGPAGSVLGQGEEIKVENLSAVGPSRNARKRARRKERELEAKKVKMDC